MSIKDKLAIYAQVLEEEPMGKHTTYHVGGDVDYYIYPNNGTSLMRIINILESENIPFFIMGRGSNILFSDKPFHGAIINLDRTMNDFYIEEDGTVIAQAGCSIINLSVQAMKNNLTGLEWASGIPGSVGGALYMNAGAYKSNMEAIVEEVCVLKNHSIVCMKAEDLDFGYRHSIFQTNKDWVILACKLHLELGKYEDIADLMDSRRARRMASQPLDKPCAGSVFRNPEQMPAWKLIDEMGFRGFQIGGAKVSEKHSNFIVNENNTASASDIRDLIDLIRRQAKEKYGIHLITEVEQLNW